MEDRLDALQKNPSNWQIRGELVSELYEEAKYEEAADLLSQAPEIPGDEGNIIFAATVLSVTDPESSRALLDHFESAHGPTAATEQLRVHLSDKPSEVAPVARATPESAPVANRAEPIHATEVETQSIEESDFEPVEISSGNRTFSIGAGEVVQAAEFQTRPFDKIGAVLIAAMIHLVIVALLFIWKLSSPPNSPPQITVSSVVQPQEETIENETVTKQEQKQAAAAPTAQPVVTSQAISNFAIPTTFDATTDLNMVAMSNSDAGFGMSLTGFGDVSNMDAIPKSMQSRCSMSQRMKRLRESGGEDRAERAVREGLEFLATQQNDDGSIGTEFPAAMTGLSLLAFLGHCETPESPKFGDTVVNATLYLMERCNKNDGKITNGKSGNHQAYEHAIATYALSELYTMTRESGKDIPRLESTLKKAVGIIVDAQAKGGGWAYGFKPNNRMDMSVSGWQIQALKAAHNTGRRFSGVDRALDKAIKEYLPSIQDSAGAFKYTPDQASGKQTLTGAALLAMQIWEGGDPNVFDKGFAYLKSKYSNPAPGNGYYAPYYNTQVFFLAEGKAWENYNSKFQPRLLDAQNEDGSWLRPGISHGGKDSQILNTAWAILMLEVYYRYLPTTDKVDELKPR